MMTAVPYNDSPWKVKCHPYESGLRIIHVTTCSKYHGGLETVWIVRCPVTGKTLAERPTEEAARQRAREIAAERGQQAA